MITVRPASQRLHTRIGWLDSRHTFTFEEHIDPRYMGYRALRVLNEDRIAPSHGFGLQPRRDLEILTWVLAGTLRHDDSLGTSALVHAGSLQRLTAGTGVLHSEFNASDTEPLHLLQAWITPARLRTAPAYEQRTFDPRERCGRLSPIASRDGRNGSVRLQQDLYVYAGELAPGDVLTHTMAPDRHAWIQVTRGRIQLNGVELKAGDGAGVAACTTLELCALSASDTLLFDLA